MPLRVVVLDLHHSRGTRGLHRGLRAEVREVVLDGEPVFRRAVLVKSRNHVDHSSLRAVVRMHGHPLTFWNGSHRGVRAVGTCARGYLDHGTVVPVDVAQDLQKVPQARHQREIPRGHVDVRFVLPLVLRAGSGYLPFHTPSYGASSPFPGTLCCSTP